MLKYLEPRISREDFSKLMIPLRPNSPNDVRYIKVGKRYIKKHYLIPGTKKASYYPDVLDGTVNYEMDLELHRLGCV